MHTARIWVQSIEFFMTQYAYGFISLVVSITWDIFLVALEHHFRSFSARLGADKPSLSRWLSWRFMNFPYFRGTQACRNSKLNKQIALDCCKSPCAFPRSFFRRIYLQQKSCNSYSILASQFFDYLCLMRKFLSIMTTWRGQSEYNWHILSLKFHWHFKTSRGVGNVYALCE